MTRWIVAAAYVLCLGACSRDTSASQVEFDFGSFADFTCSDAQFQKEQFNEFFIHLPDAKRLPIERQLRQAEVRCLLYTEIMNGAAETFEQLREGVWIPRRVYLFDLDQTDGSEKPIWRRVGYFDSESECREFQGLVEGEGVRVGSCYSRLLFCKIAWK